MTANCVDLIRSAVNGKMSDDELISLYERVKKMRETISRRKDRVSDLNAEIKRQIRTQGEEKIAELIGQKRSAILHATAILKAENHIATHGAGNEYAALSAMIVGGQRNAFGGRASVDASSQALAGYYVGGMLSDIEALNGPHLKMWQKGVISRDIARAMWTIDNPDAPPYSGPKEAMDLAKIIHKWQEAARSDANRAGALIGKMPGYIVRQSHDPLKIGRAGFEAWKNEIIDRIDWERTGGFELTGNDAEDMAAKVAWLSEVYGNLVSGVRVMQGEKTITRARRGNYGGNVASRLSQERVIHFASGEAWFDYNEKFGIGTLQDAVVHGFSSSAQATALMRKFGPSPQAAVEKIFNDTQMQMRVDGRLEDARRFGKKHAAIIKQLREVDGTLNLSGDPHLSAIGRIIRALQSMSKLGGAVVSAISDEPIMAAEFAYQGCGFYHSLWRGMTLALRGRGTAEQRRILAQIGVFSDSMAGSLAANFSGDDVPGAITRMQTLFFKATGLTWWTDSHRKAAGLMMASDLAAEKSLSWDGLTPARRNVLSLYGIDAKRWEVIRLASNQAADGREYLTPDGLLDVPDAAFEALLSAEGRKVSAEAVSDLRWEIADQLRTYFRDRISYASLEPDAKTRSMLRQGTSAGTPEGEALRCIMQFKSFPIAFLQKVWGRETLGRGASSVRQVLQNEGGSLVSIANLCIMMGAFGYISMTAKELLKGRNPRKWWESPEMAYKTFIAAMLQGGGLGIFGDFLFGESNRFGGGIIASLAGPTAGTIEEIHSIYTRVRDGDTLGQGVLRTALGLVPGSNIWYARGVFDYLIGYQLYEMMNPGYFRRMQRRVERENNQTYWLRPLGT